MNHDIVPSLTGALALASAVQLPGPTQNEWTTAAVGLFALVVRELVWFFRNRNRSK